MMNQKQKQLLDELLTDYINQLNYQLARNETSRKLRTQLKHSTEIHDKTQTKLEQQKTLAITTQLQLAYTQTKEN